MPSLVDRIIEEMRRRTRPVCISCLSTALNADYKGVREASHDAEVLKAFGRSFARCPDCQIDGVVLHPHA